ncbi:MAG: hypothetical protein LBC72_03955 [Spirochaetaceae bacterium]|jgi:hypothetical protein|nr:hypothetical protein [Spirochaetaceae bacterium]
MRHVKKCLLPVLFLAVPLLLTGQSDDAAPPAPATPEAAASAAPPAPAAQEAASAASPAPATPEAASATPPAPATPEAAAHVATVPRWTGSVPEELRRPRRDEQPVFPHDAVIGELGRGQAEGGVYRYARNVLYDLVMQKKTSAFLKNLDEAELASLFEKLAQVAPRKYRLGGGLVEPDGSVSFLYRFLGREYEAFGSVYFLAGEDGKFSLDAIIMEDVVETGKTLNLAEYPYLPHERFY